MGFSSGHIFNTDVDMEFFAEVGEDRFSGAAVFFDITELVLTRTIDIMCRIAEVKMSGRTCSRVKKYEKVLFYNICH